MTSTPDQPRDGSLRHLLDRAIGVEERVRRAVYARQSTDPQPDDPFRGLYLSDETIHRLLEDGRSIAAAPDETGSALRAAAEARADIADASGTPTRLRTLTRDFNLTQLDVEILLIALIPDLDDRFEQFYGYLNDDVTRRLADLEKRTGGRLGVSVLDTQTNISFGYRGSEAFAMCSTFKVLASGMVLARVDGGEEGLPVVHLTPPRPRRQAEHSSDRRCRRSVLRSG